MLNLKKPPKLREGDKVAAISLSAGLAGDTGLRWRYETGKKRLTRDFGLDVIEMPHTLSGSEALRLHPEHRAADLMEAFADPTVKGIFTCIGGNDSIRMLPYIDFGVIAASPKIFLGYSDTTVTHFICAKAGLSSFYGASIMAEFAENVRMFEYTAHWLRKTLFETEPLGRVSPASAWTGERIPWEEKNKNIPKKMEPHEGYEILQGRGIARGRLIGGCMEVLEAIKQTDLWPDAEVFDGALLFLETSESAPEPAYVEQCLRDYVKRGILHHAAGIIWGRPTLNRYAEDYRRVITTVLSESSGLTELPILFNLCFGHNEPMCCLPYGALAEIHCECADFTVLEAGVGER